MYFFTDRLKICSCFCVFIVLLKHRGSEKSIIGGGGHINLLVFGTNQFLLKSIVFTVCEHECMNMGPPPIIDIPTPLLEQSAEIEWDLKSVC